MAAERIARVDEPWYKSAGWEKPWNESLLGSALVVFFQAVVVSIAFVTTAEGQRLFGVEFSPAATVPLELYVAGVLGAFGYVFTRLFIAHEDVIDGSNQPIQTIVLFRVGLTVAGALPLVFGITALATVIGINDAGLLGAAFLSGMFVRVIHKQFGSLADKLGPKDAESPDAVTPVNDSP